ncbi:response regulator transcription factor [Cohnella yongneupensis]|uniref:Response regulator transcription factor n=1 Tax=Cohnella yongneupensis TaxID=425006 RepID=A0ABW0R4V3_9BACL
MSKYHVLVVDDDIDILGAIEIYLKSEGIAVSTARNGQEALELLKEKEVHLVILDVMMPLMDGIQATFKIREQLNVPILMLSAKTEDNDKIIGLNVGADDYMTKPFNPLELIARVKSQLRRYTNLGRFSAEDNEGEKLCVRGLTLDRTTKEVTVEGEDVRLTPTEYKILELLMLHKGRVFSIDEIYEKVWKDAAFNADNAVAVHIRRIREKIEINAKDPKYIKVVWGIGYKMEK